MVEIDIQTSHYDYLPMGLVFFPGATSVKVLFLGVHFFVFFWLVFFDLHYMCDTVWSGPSFLLLGSIPLESQPTRKGCPFFAIAFGHLRLQIT